MDLPESVATIASRSRFEHLHVTGSRYQGRYGVVYDTLAGTGDRQQNVSLRLLDRPQQSDSQFSEMITNVLDEFAPISDHDKLVDVFDYGTVPRPWIATVEISERLTARNPMDFVSPLSVARELVDGVSYLHQQDRTHGGLDPKSVVFVGESFEGVVQGQPLIDNTGLFSVYRYQFEPESYLEPAYAAPEYYSEEFGTVDHQTDIYQLGAVLHYLVTGQPPFSGPFAQIQEQVLQDEPPTPSAAGAPAQFDDIIRKAMARDKIRRYETVQYLKQDLARTAANRDHEWVDGE